jgi:small nuclear ribonucleoprotein (snRNP)-like protein
VSIYTALNPEMLTYITLDQLPNASDDGRWKAACWADAGIRQGILFLNTKYTRWLTSAQHMNLVLADCEEFRKVKRKSKTSSAPGAGGAGQVVETEEKRMLGLAIIRGATVVSCSVEGPPPADPAARLGQNSGAAAPTAMQAGPGISRPAGRGSGGAGLQGPAAGVGGPGFPQGFPGRGKNLLSRIPAFFGLIDRDMC